MANWISHLKTLLRTSVSIQELEAHNPQLLQLNTWYCNNVEQIKTYVYCETRPTHGILVVNETSANPGIPGVFPIPQDADHVTICKPADKTASVYLRVKRLIEEARNKALFLAPHPSPLPEGEGAECRFTNAAVYNIADSNAGNTTVSASYPGTAKIAFCERLGHDWQQLADLLEIKASEQAKWARGNEARALWEWLEQRTRLAELPKALIAINRNDLAQELNRHPN